jgi:hypothetical protein
MAIVVVPPLFEPFKWGSISDIPSCKSVIGLQHIGSYKQITNLCFHGISHINKLFYLLLIIESCDASILGLWWFSWCILHHLIWSWISLHHGYSNCLMSFYWNEPNDMYIWNSTLMSCFKHFIKYAFLVMSHHW